MGRDAAPEEAVEGQAVAEKILGVAGQSAAGECAFPFSPQVHHLCAQHAPQALQPRHLVQPTN